MAYNDDGSSSLDAHGSWTDDPYMFEDNNAESNDTGVFEQLCGSILSLLRSYRFIYSLDNETNLEELALKLDNIRIRFVIWLSINHGASCENYEAVMEILSHLDVFLLDETETILKGHAHGLKQYKADVEEAKSGLEGSVCSLLHESFQFQINKYLIKRDISGFMRSIYYTWIVVDYTDCLSFLATIDTLLEDLFANTSNSRNSTLIRDYACSAIGGIPEQGLSTILLSGFSEDNMICRAAEMRYASSESGNDVRAGHIGIGTKEGMGTEEWLLGSRADTDSLASSSSPVFTPTTSEAPLEVQERFALIADHARRSREFAITQVYPDGQLAERRILAELRSAESAPPFATVACIDDSISDLLGAISGPPGTPYERGIFFVRIKIPEEYPLVPAGISFITKIYHPNIDSTGQIYAATKSRDWGINCSVWGILTSIYSLLAAPVANNAVVPAIRAELMWDRKAFEATAKEWTEQFANGDWPSRDELAAHVCLVPTKIGAEKGHGPGSGGAGKQRQDLWTRKQALQRKKEV